jgi:hypothetical protein
MQFPRRKVGWIAMSILVLIALIKLASHFGLLR